MSRLSGLLLPLLVLLLAPGPPPVAARGVLETSPEELRLLMSLHAFTKLYGYVRYFHPSDAAAELDWNRFVIHGLSRVIPARHRDELKTTLEELFLPIAPSLVLHVGRLDPVPLTPPSGPAELSLVAWQHRGLGSRFGHEVFRSVRASPGAGALFAAFPEPGQTVVKELADGLFCVLPLALWADGEGTLPRGDGEALAALRARLAAVPDWDPAQYAHRVAPVVAMWAMLQHFDPHMENLRLSWEQYLIGGFRGMQEARTAEDVLAVLRLHLLVPIADAQARVRRPGLEQDRAWLPLAVEWVNGEVVVGASQVAGILPGDVLLEVDGRRFVEVLDQEQRYLSGSFQHRRAAALEVFGSGEPGSEAEVRVVRDGEPSVRRAARAARARVLPFSRAPIGELGHGALYVDLRRLDAALLARELPRLAAAPALVFDLRGEIPEDGLAVLAHLIDEPVETPPWDVALRIFPDQEGAVGWLPVGERRFEPAEPRLEGRLAFLADGHTRGAAETFLAIVERRELGTIAGECTAGTGGPTQTLELPGSIELRLTLTRPRSAGGQESFLEGICPDEEVALTADALRAGRDEVLEQALVMIGEP